MSQISEGSSCQRYSIKPENLILGFRETLNQLLLLPLFHHEDHIGLLNVFAGEGLGTVIGEAESLGAGDMPDHLARGAAQPSVDAGGNDTHFTARMGQVFPDVLFHVAVQVGAARDVGLAGNENGKFFAEQRHEREDTHSGAATQICVPIFCCNVTWKNEVNGVFCEPNWGDGYEKTFKVIAAIFALGGIILLLLHVFLLFGLTKTMREAVLPQIKEQTGLDVRVGGLSINIPNGRMVLESVEVRNPEGFLLENALSVGRINLELDMATLVSSEPILIRDVSVDDVRLNVIRNRDGEFNVIKLQEGLPACRCRSPAPKGLSRR